MSNKENFDTIAAIATPHGKGAIGIIRISGTQSFKILSAIFKGKRRYGYIHEPANPSNILDEVIVNKYYAPNSYTGEDMVEINTHGGRFVTNAVLSAVLSQGARLAEPGEFTKRALLNGKIDLIKAEGILEIIEAKSKIHLKSAISHLTGKLSSKFKILRDDLLEALTLLCATIDFPEDDIDIRREKIFKLLQKLICEIEDIIHKYKPEEYLTHDIAVSIIGAPNVGKSSLFNAILKDNRAIVTDIPGTTRDVIEAEFFLSDFSVKIYDTAGIRKTTNLIETLGIKKTYEFISKSSLCFIVFDLTDKKSFDFVPDIELPPTRIALLNKIDIAKFPILDINVLMKNLNIKKENIIFCSALTGEGIDKIYNRLTEYLKKLYDKESAYIVSKRHYNCLNQAYSLLKSAFENLEKGCDDISVFELSCCSEKLEELIGEINSEDILNSIFSRFCVGK